jgi:hypothetical protein
MKKTIPILFVLLSFSLQAQVTINRSDLVVSGQKAIQATHSRNHGMAASGANMTWDFSDLMADESDSLRFGLPFWYKGNENFPNANLAYISYGEDSTIYFMSATSTEFRVFGYYQYTDTSEDILQFDSKIIGFPSTYNTAFTESTTVNGGSFELGVDPDSTGPLPFIDSLRFNYIRTVKSNIDGWGNMTTPLGTYPSLKQTSLEIGTQSVDMKSNGVWTTIPKVVLTLLNIPVPEPDSNFSVNVWTNDARVGFPLVSYSYSPGQDSAYDVTWLKSSLKASKIATVGYNNIHVFPNPFSNQLNIQTDIASINIDMYAADGKLIYSETLSDKKTINMAHLPAGVYHLIAKDASNGSTLTNQTLIKQ